ncbi:MAG: glycosyltransferase family 4 protein, partial [Chloroflexi bacterium]|nr:glycosyltransferase family 4 protein [Chloroflexota bacterium]
LAVRAFAQLGLPLRVIGEGRDRAALETMAGPTVQFLGYQPDDEVRRQMACCRAFVFPGEEDFGITPLEASSAGRPVIAYAAGGALDTVVEGVTGLFFREPTPESLAQAVRRLEPSAYAPAVLRAHAERYSVAAFQRQLASALES